MTSLKKLVKTAEKLDRPEGEEAGWLTLTIETLMFCVGIVFMLVIGVVAALLGAQGVTKD